MVSFIGSVVCTGCLYKVVSGYLSYIDIDIDIDIDIEIDITLP